ncbi:MAG TPA: hypothetical protein VFM36_04445, partial [Thermoanaerobaculia bacterium]|nr:hypothetical protein [Thermoanaerobaculia bacterium]
HIATQQTLCIQVTAPRPNFEKGDTTHGCIEEAFFEEIVEEILEKGRRAESVCQQEVIREASRWCKESRREEGRRQARRQASRGVGQAQRETPRDVGSQICRW